MIRTKSIISSVNEIPREWVFEFYLKCEKLCGQDVKIKSVFSTEDKTPSMFVYYCKTAGYYKFKDFSAGKSGDGTTFVQEYFKLTTRGEAAHKMIEDYNQYILTDKEDYSVREFKVQQRYKVSTFETRSWTTLDQKYWTKFHIGSKKLAKYNVVPLSSYKMTKEEDGETKELNVVGRHYIYGYFRTDGTLFMIYQPMVKECKFIRIKDYIQGTDQLTFKVPYLIITSSYKDLMDFDTLGYSNAESVAPNSENTLIPEHIISAYKLKYKSICTLFDNDKAGIDAMAKYKEKYGIPGVHLELSKDLSDSIRDYGIHKVKEILTPLIKEQLNKKNTTCNIGNRRLSTNSSDEQSF